MQLTPNASSIISRLFRLSSEIFNYRQITLGFDSTSFSLHTIAIEAEPNRRHGCCHKLIVFGRALIPVLLSFLSRSGGATGQPRQAKSIVSGSGVLAPGCECRHVCERVNHRPRLQYRSQANAGNGQSKDTQEAVSQSTDGCRVGKSGLPLTSTIPSDGHNINQPGHFSNRLSPGERIEGDSGVNLIHPDYVNPLLLRDRQHRVATVKSVGRHSSIHSKINDTASWCKPSISPSLKSSFYLHNSGRAFTYPTFCAVAWTFLAFSRSAGDLTLKGVTLCPK
jgi:hypothetical protein